MRSFNKLALSLLLVFILSLLCLTATLLILLRHRRRQLRQPLDTESGRKGASFNFLCCSFQSRVEPAGSSPEVGASGGRQVKIPAAEEECDLAVWREMAICRSRVLYTIKEEEREGMELEEREEEDFFATPCASPEFFTPVSSPARAPAAGDGFWYFSVIG